MPLSFTQNAELEKQRYERLREVVSEYLDDEGQDPRVFLIEFKKALRENAVFFESRAAAYSYVLNQTVSHIEEPSND